MENTEIMNEVAKVTENTAFARTGNRTLKIMAGIGVSIFVGEMVYNYVAKPIYTKIKTKIQEKKNKESQPDDEE